MKWVVVTEQNQPWAAWAGKKQFLLWPFAAQVTIPNGSSLDAAATKLEQAAKIAGQGGAIILSVGHGGLASTGDGRTDEGFFDLAPSGFRVAGNNAVLTGQTGEGKKAQVSSFYDFVPTFGGGIKAKSRKQEDEDRAKSSNPNVSGPAKTRLAHWERYLEIGKAFESNGVGALILLTCKVGQATDFLKRTRAQLRVPIAAYKRRVMGVTVEHSVGSKVVAKRTRIFLEGDADGKGTNIEMGEFWIPMPPTSNWTIIP